MEALLSKGSLKKHFLTMSVPAWIAILSMFLFGIADAWFIAQLGTEPLAGYAFAYPVIAVVFGSLEGLTVAISTTISQALGHVSTQGSSKCKQEPLRIATSALILVGTIYLLLAIIGHASIEILFSFLGASDEIMPYLSAYMRIWFLVVMPLSALVAVFQGVYYAYGNTKLPSKLIVGGVLVNIALDPILIFGIDGFIPAQGIEGAAWATAISYGVILICYVTTWLMRPSSMRFRRINLSQFKRCVITLYATIYASIFESTAEPLADVLVFMIIAPLGTETIAAVGIAYKLFDIAASPFYALQGVTGSIVGQNYGAGKIKRIRAIWSLLLKVCLFLSLVSGVIFTLTSTAIIESFNQSFEVNAIAILFVRLVMWTIGGAGIMDVLIGILYGIKQTKMIILMRSVDIIICYIIPIAIAVHLAESKGVPYGWAIGDILSGIIASIVYYTYVRPKLLTSKKSRFDLSQIS